MGCDRIRYHQLHSSADVETLDELNRITSVVGDASLRDQLMLQAKLHNDEQPHYSRQNVANKRRKLENKKRECFLYDSLFSTIHRSQLYTADLHFTIQNLNV